MSTKQNLCSPNNIYNIGDAQYMFLGCSIMSATCTVGWGNQVTQVTVNLAQDTCAVPVGGNPKVYYDAKLIRRTTYAADPGPYIYTLDSDYPKAPPVNSPVYFRLGEFEFCGIIQSFDKSNGPDGKPTYTCVIVAPSQILEGAQIIIDDYAGSVYNIHNLFNAFGYMESFGTPCAERTEPVGTDAVFGTPAGGFGGANVNENGMQVSKIITAVSLLTSAFPKIASVYSPYGRLIYKGAEVGGYGLIRYDRYEPSILTNYGNASYLPNQNYHDGYLAEYFIDLSSLPVPPTYWRIADTRVSVMDLITQVCQDAGCDFFIELVPFTSGTQSITKIIKVRTVSRNAQPRLGRIEEFIGNTDGVMTNSIGLESRQEVTETFLIGGKRQIVFQVSQDNTGDADYTDDIIVPFWGYDVDGNAIVSEKTDEDKWRFTVDCSALNLTITNPIGGNSLTLVEDELQAALGGYDSWLSYIGSVETESYLALVDAGYEVRGKNDATHLTKVIDEVGAQFADEVQPQDAISSNLKVAPDLNDFIAKDMEKIFNFISSYATDYYGVKFMVRIPYTCKRTDSESGLVITSEEPSDGGWTTQDNVLSLPNPSVLTDFFSLEDGRIGCFVRFADADKMDIDALDINEYGIIDNKLFVKATLEEKLVYVEETPRVVVVLSQPVMNKESVDIHGTGAHENVRLQDEVAKQMANEGIFDNIRDKAGAAVTFTPFLSQAQMFEAAAIPLKSNIHTYGPWYVPGPPGVTRVETDDGLVPWEYGGMDTMDLAGNSKVEEGITYMQAGEMGSITVPGFPTIPLGGELGATYGSGGSQLIENRSIVMNNFEGEHVDDGNVNYTYYGSDLPQWRGIYGPNITSINITIGEGGAQTSYTMRTYTPSPGRFTRGNAERIKKFGLNRLSIVKAIRLKSAQQQVLSAKFGNLNRKNKGINAISNQQGQHRSPHQVLVGTVNDWRENSRRVSVVSETINEATSELANNYSKKAIMSWDGLVRPVQTYEGGGSGTFPQLLDTLSPSTIRGASLGMPPILNSSSVPQYDLAISSRTLNPLVVYLGSDNYSDTPNVHHDFEIVGRGSTPPASSLVIPIQDYAEANEIDTTEVPYRFMALRGPLVVTGWGFDIDGKPVPNKADVEADASGGIFVSTNLEDKFLDNWLQKPHTWPVGPVDLRWDRKRSVWTVPQNRMLVGTVDWDDINNTGIASYEQIMSEQLYDSDGTSFVGSAKFEVVDTIGFYDTQPTGTYNHKVYGIYEPNHGAYHIIGTTLGAPMYWGVANHSISAMSGTLEVGTLVPMGGVALDGVSTITALNWAGWQASAGATCLIGARANEWLLIQIECD